MIATRKGRTPEFIRLGSAALSVRRRLLDLANSLSTRELHPELPRLLIGLAGELRRGFRPRRSVRARAQEAA